MTDTDRRVAPPSAARGTLPGDIHIWVMVLGDLVIFGAYFVIFMIYRARSPQIYLADQQHLDLTAGVINTIVLLTSSWCVAQAVLRARAGAHAHAVRLLYVGSGLGVLFIAIKAYEWATKIATGYTFGAGEFFAFYYMLTGVHVFHVGLGLVILTVVIRELRNPHRSRMPVVESGAIYWHMVDLLWIVIFTLFYVLR